MLHDAIRPADNWRVNVLLQAALCCFALTPGAERPHDLDDPFFEKVNSYFTAIANYRCLQQRIETQPLIGTS